MTASLVLPAAQSMVGLLELVPAPLIAVSGLAAIDLLGDGVACLTWFQWMPANDGTGLERHAAARLVTPVAALTPEMVMTEAFLDRQRPRRIRVPH